MRENRDNKNQNETNLLIHINDFVFKINYFHSQE